MADLSSPEEISIFEDLRRHLEDAGIAFGSDLSFLPLELDEPTLDDTMPDNERLLRAVSAATGADVINRIIESGKPGGRKRLQDAVIKESIIPMLSFMYREAGINPRRVYRMVLAGNTTMNHLLLGLHAGPIRTEPFVPSFSAQITSTSGILA